MYNIEGRDYSQDLSNLFQFDGLNSTCHEPRHGTMVVLWSMHLEGSEPVRGTAQNNPEYAYTCLHMPTPTMAFLGFLFQLCIQFGVSCMASSGSLWLDKTSPVLLMKSAHFSWWNFQFSALADLAVVFEQTVGQNPVTQQLTQLFNLEESQNWAENTCGFMRHW